MAVYNRSHGLHTLETFLPHAGLEYARTRNTDSGPGRARTVSRLSPYVRHRLVSEAEILSAGLQHHGSLDAFEKFASEVLWRTYWKGWLAQRPAIWSRFTTNLIALDHQLASDAQLRSRYETAISGRTGIDCFDAWTAELEASGWLHNHARMWWASIWIFTLRLPWELGAAWFLSRLHDGDTAANTLSWRWIAGLHTPGKHYLARPENIARHTDGRFRPSDLLVTDAQALPFDGHPAPQALPDLPLRLAPATGPRAWLLHLDDLWGGLSFEIAPHDLILALPHPDQIAGTSLGAASASLSESRSATLLARLDDLGPSPRIVLPESLDAPALVKCLQEREITEIAGLLPQVGPQLPRARALERALQPAFMKIHWIQRQWDAVLHPLASKGFFAFRQAAWPRIGDLTPE